MRYFISLFIFVLSVIPLSADEYIDPETNVVYVYSTGNPNAIVKGGDKEEMDNGTTEYVSGNPNAKGDIRILEKFAVNGKEYVVNGIGDFAFALNKEIISVYIPSTIETLGTESFLGCVSLETLSMSEGLKTIGQACFSGCSSLLSLTLPEGLENLGFEAFSQCKSLKSVHIPSSLTTIKPLPFYGCDNLEYISVEEGNPTYDSRDGCNAVIEKTTNMLVFGCKSTVIPSSVNYIGENAFFGCKGLEKLVIPESVIAVKSSAFNGCENLREIVFPQSLKTIGSYAFSGCNLMSVAIPSGVEGIDAWAFNIPMLVSVVSLIKEPFSIHALCDFDKVSPVLLVPVGTREKYKATEGWNLFKTIEEVDGTGIEQNRASVSYGKDCHSYSYDLQGRPVSQPSKGVYIENGRKRVVR